MPSNKPESRLIKAAGGVAWRPGPDGEPEILLVHRKKYDDWSLPKGKTEPGEPLPVTAVREVLEEGGARLALGRRLASVRYNVGGRPKRVHYWAARVLSVDDRAVPNAEVDEVDWVPAGRAVERVSYAHDHGVLADFAARPAADRPADPAAARQGGGQARLEARRRPPARSTTPAAPTPRPWPTCSPASPPAPADQLARGPLPGNPPPARRADRRAGAGRAVPLHSQPVIPNGPGRLPPPPLPPCVREAIAAGEPTVICAHRENLPVLQAAALAALGATQPPSDAAPGSALAHSALSASAEATSAQSGPAQPPLPDLPKEWDDPLPTSGFWVLNLALPAPSPATPATSAPPASPLGRPRARSAARAAPHRPAWRRLVPHSHPPAPHHPARRPAGPLSARRPPGFRRPLRPIRALTRPRPEPAPPRLGYFGRSAWPEDPDSAPSSASSGAVVGHGRTSAALSTWAVSPGRR